MEDVYIIMALSSTIISGSEFNNYGAYWGGRCVYATTSSVTISNNEFQSGHAYHDYGGSIC